MASSYDRAPAGRSQPGAASRGGVQKMGGSSGLAEVLSVILEKGIVVDVWVRVSIIGIGAADEDGTDQCGRQSRSHVSHCYAPSHY